MLCRYAFGRWWGDEDVTRSAVWVMLNPATGDTDGKKRPTLERAIARSKQWNAQGIVVVNLFAYRGTNPAVLTSAADLIGPANDHTLELLTTLALLTVAAWGSKGRLRQRSTEVRSLLSAPLCLGATKRGELRHPLYVNQAARAIPLP
jgi:hypothetical protein